MFTPPTELLPLKQAVLGIAAFFDEKRWQWTLEGGAALGIAKVRGLLPWHSGLIKVNVRCIVRDKKYSIKRNAGLYLHVSNEIRHCLEVMNKEFITRHPVYRRLEYPSINKVDEVFLRPTHTFANVVSITFIDANTGWDKVVRMNFEGAWLPVSRKVFVELRSLYGDDYFQHKMSDSHQHIHCSERSNACLPDFRKISNGRGGIWEEHFVER